MIIRCSLWCRWDDMRSDQMSIEESSPRQERESLHPASYPTWRFSAPLNSPVFFHFIEYQVLPSYRQHHHHNTPVQDSLKRKHPLWRTQTFPSLLQEVPRLNPTWILFSVLFLVSYVYDGNECECVPGDNLWRDFPCRVWSICSQPALHICWGMATMNHHHFYFYILAYLPHTRVYVGDIFHGCYHISVQLWLRPGNGHYDDVWSWNEDKFVTTMTTSLLMEMMATMTTCLTYQGEAH